MSYTKHTWTDGELVTAAKLNNIENGIEEASSGGGSGGGVLVVGVTIDGNTATLDKTWQQIADADFAVLKGEVGNTAYSIETLSAYGAGEGTYWVHFGGPDGELPDLNASSADGYPSVTMG